MMIFDFPTLILLAALLWPSSPTVTEAQWTSFSCAPADIIEVDGRWYCPTFDLNPGSTIVTGTRVWTCNNCLPDGSEPTR